MEHPRKSDSEKEVEEGEVLTDSRVGDGGEGRGLESLSGVTGGEAGC